MLSYYDLNALTEDLPQRAQRWSRLIVTRFGPTLECAVVLSAIAIFQRTRKEFKDSL
jgi:hypothetical protein